MEAHWTWIDLIVLVAYFIGTMGIGAYFYFTGKSRDTEGYTAAGRSLSGIVVGLSIMATFLSSISFLALPGAAYMRNWNQFVFSLALPIAAFIAVKYFLPYYRARKEVSAYHHIETRFGPWARLYMDACYLLMQIGRMGSVMFLMALPLHALLGWSVPAIVIVTGISVIIYSLFGGIIGVIWADAIQSVVLMGGALLCVILMLFNMPEGAGQIFEIANEHNKFSLGSFNPFEFTAATFWIVLVYGIFINLNNFGIDQNYVQRYAASRSDSEAAKSLWLGALLYIPVSALFFFIGTSLFAYYTAHPDALPPEIVQRIEDGTGDYVFPFYIVSQLPTGVTGLLIAAIFAAAMSTVSTSLNSSATILMTDFYRRYLRPDATDRQTMNFLYGSTLGLGILGTLVGVAMIRAEGVLDTWWDIQGIFAGGMLGLFLLGMVSRRAKNPGAIAGVIAGVLMITWLSLPGLLGDATPDAIRNPLHSNLTIVIGTATILLVGFLVTALYNGKDGSDSAGNPD